MLLQKIENWQLRRVRERRRIAAYAPYPFAKYDAILHRVLRQRLTVSEFDAPDEAGAAKLFLRHDIDFAGCVDGLAPLLDIEAQYGLPSATFIRVDRQDYEPEALRPLVAARRKAGLEFGLHSSFYVDDDPLGRFRRELAAFQGIFGFAPRTFTIHGLGGYRADIREAVSEEIVARRAEFGIAFTDCSAAMRRYDMILQDCDIEPQTGARCMYSDLANFPLLPRKGRNYLILTHPCYWRRSAG
jgi:hypothetical protein